MAPGKKGSISAVVFHPFFLEATTTSQETSTFPDWWCQMSVPGNGMIYLQHSPTFSPFSEHSSNSDPGTFLGW